MYSRIHWSYRYLIFTCVADVLSKFAVSQLLELGSGHLFVRYGWGVGIIWIEHTELRMSFGWPFAIGILAIWIFLLPRIINAEPSPPRWFIAGMAIAFGGGIANGIDAGIDGSVLNWIAIVTPRVNKAFNIADVALSIGVLTMLPWYVRLAASAVMTRYRRRRREP